MLSHMRITHADLKETKRQLVESDRLRFLADSELVETKRQLTQAFDHIGALRQSSNLTNRELIPLMMTNRDILGRF